MDPTLPVTAVVVGPCAVRALRGPAGRLDLAAAALAGVDDEFVLVDEQPVAVAGLWREVFTPMLDDDAALLVCPSWWSDYRIATVRDAAHRMVPEVAITRRSAMLASAVPNQPAVVVEITESFVALSRPADDQPAEVVSRESSPKRVAEEVARLLASIGGGGGVVVDRADGVPGATDLAALIADRLRTDQIAVIVVDDDRLLRTAERSLSVAEERQRPLKPARSRLARFVPLAAGVGATGVLVAVMAAAGREPQPTTLLVEGRVVVEVPASWSARRITAGPGSARVQVMSPTDSHAAVHVTQSLVPSGETLQRTADTLRRAMLDEPPDVFVDFNPDDRRGDRPAVTYREIRDGHDIRWAVLLDGDVRISVGCQSPRDSEEAVRAVCERAIASARNVGELPGTVAPQRQSNNT